MTASLKLSWHQRVSLSTGAGEAIVAGPAAKLSLRPVAPAILKAMQRLAPPGEVEETLADAILADGDVDSLARWYFHVEQFRQRGLICRTLHGDEGPFVTLVPLCHAIPTSSAGNPPIPKPGISRRPNRRINGGYGGVGRHYSLSRFAYLRRDGTELVLESPLSSSRLVLHDARAMTLIGTLAVRATLAEVCEQNPSLSPDLANRFVFLLENAAMIDTSDEDQAGKTRADEFESWEFHDLLFHSRSRRGRNDAQFGATYRFAHRPPPPPLKPIAAGPSYDLYRPDLDQLEREDPPFALVQNKRCSVRKYSSDPITVRQLGEFLYRVGRVTATWTAEIPGGGDTMEFAGRPYPAGGALYELEMYPVVRACRDLPTGMYAYEPAAHRLRLVAGCTPEVESILDDAAASAGVDPLSVQLLIVLASRFGRIAWKYESIAYALTLKHVGVVYQTMYLTATAMGLAPCAVGCGDSDLFARAAGTEYHVESSVGEFLLGSRG